MTEITEDQQKLTITITFRVSQEQIAKMAIIARRFELPIPLIMKGNEPKYHSFVRQVTGSLVEAYFTSYDGELPELVAPDGEAIPRLLKLLQTGDLTSPAFLSHEETRENIEVEGMTSDEHKKITDMLNVKSKKEDLDGPSSL